MEKLKMQTESKVNKNIELIGKLFPSTLTEAIKGYDEQDNPIIEHAIDFDMLKQELSNVVVEGTEERYQMNWPDKKKHILLANTPINDTLRPCREESVDFDKTENLYIEGDNLEVLKLLQETYLNRVKMIYIDPPYNTGNDSFVYNDDFKMDSDEFCEASGQYDEDGYMMFDIRKNNESNGKFHTDWLNMIYPRLKLAKDLLTDDGVIFISIGNEEIENCKKICNEIFGEDNFRNSIIIRRGAKNLQSQFDNIDSLNSGYEYVLMYSKSINERFEKIYKETGQEIVGAWNNHWRGTDRPTMRYELFGIKPDKGQWRWGEQRSLSAIQNYEEMLKELKNDSPTQKEIDDWYVGKVPSGDRIDLLRLSRNGKPEHYIPPSNKQLLNDLWDDLKPNGSSFTSKLFDEKIFDNPKSVDLMVRLLEFVTYEDSVILDFFSGSSTTAHAVMQLNSKDDGNRKFIMVQLPEETEEKSEAFKAGYKNICEIGKERIRRAGKKIKEEHPDKTETLDTGFRVLKLDSTNMKDVFYKPVEYTQTSLDGFAENIKEDRTAYDLLFQVMLELGELLSSDIEETVVAGKKIFNVGHGDIIACFDSNITNEVVIEIAKLKPFYAVFRDSSMANDSVATNFDQIFQTYSPSTVRKVL